MAYLHPISYGSSIYEPGLSSIFHHPSLAHHPIAHHSFAHHVPSTIIHREPIVHHAPAYVHREPLFHHAPAAIGVPGCTLGRSRLDHVVDSTGFPYNPYYRSIDAGILF